MDEFEEIILGLVKPGDVIKFTYQKPSETREREVFVLNPNYEDKMHCIDIEGLADDLRKFILSWKEDHHIRDPQEFYNCTVRTFLSSKGFKKNIYKTFRLDKMSNLEIT